MRIEPIELNQKYWIDGDWTDVSANFEGITSVHNDHESPYYTTVYGEDSGDMVTAHAIIAPPRSWRNDVSDEARQIFTNYNLDYMLLTSELFALPEILDENYGIVLNIKDFVIDYNHYNEEDPLIPIFKIDSFSVGRKLLNFFLLPILCSRRL